MERVIHVAVACFLSPALIRAVLGTGTTELTPVLRELSIRGRHTGKGTMTAWRH